MSDQAPRQSPFSNPYSTGFRRLMSDLMKEGCAAHEPMLERLADFVRTERDYQEVGRLVMAVYEKGFHEAVDQQREALERHGLKATISR